MDPLERYIHELSSPEEALLHELDRQTNLRIMHPRMISGHIQGRLLRMIVQMLRPRSVLEIGTFTGYSALSMAAGLEEGATIDTIEVDDELEPMAQEFFDRSEHGSKIKLHIGSALEIAPTLGKQFDLAFIDGDKREYPAYYRMLMGDDGESHWCIAARYCWRTTFCGTGRWSRRWLTTTARRKESWSSTVWYATTSVSRVSFSRCAMD